MIVCTNCLIDTSPRTWVLRYNSSAVEFPKENDVSRCTLRNSEDFSSPTWERVHTRTRGHDKNDTLTMEVKTDFVEYVRKMRNAQKRYYRTKDYMVLRLSMKLESVVDKMLEEIELPEQNEPKQLDLGL